MEHVYESIVIAVKALWANKLRSFLTTLCVVISIMSIIAVVSIVEGMDVFVKTKIASQGSNVFTIQRFNQFEVFTDFDKFLESIKNPYLDMGDVRTLREEVPMAQFVDASINTSAGLSAGVLEVKNVRIRGRTEQYPAMGDFPIARGRHLQRIDIEQRRNVCVLGSDAAETLFPVSDPIGKTVKLRGKHFTVIGVGEEKSGALGGNPNIYAFIPISTYFKLYGSRRQNLEIQVRTERMEEFDAAMEQARWVMRIRHQLKPGAEDDFYINTSEQLVNIWQAISTGIFGALIGIVSITLVVGGIIIMNVMLVAVTERNREIGIRRAVGAKRGHVVLQFLIEALILTLLGGIIGIILGFTAANVVAAVSPLPYSISPLPIIAALVITFIVGIVFGVYPARKAAGLDPVVALRG